MTDVLKKSFIRGTPHLQPAPRAPSATKALARRQKHSTNTRRTTVTLKTAPPWDNTADTIPEGDTDGK